MPTMTKREKAASATYDREKEYPVEEALGVLNQLPKAKFDETVDLSMRLGVDPKHADQMVRGAIVLPHGIGKAVRVAVFAKGEKAKEAEAAGADVVGAEDLATKIQGGFTAFDSTVATPDMVGLVGRPAKVLGDLAHGVRPAHKGPECTRAVRKHKQPRTVTSS